MMDFLKGVYYGVLQLDPHSIAFAILLLLIVLCLFRAMFTMAITALLMCVFILGALDYTPQEIYYKAKEKIDQVEASLHKTILPILQEQLKEADVKHFKDGTYEIVTSDIKIAGKKGESKITLYFNDKEYKFDIGAFGKEIEKTLQTLSEDSKTPSKTPNA